jgi:serine/threonine-protein kinase
VTACPSRDDLERFAAGEDTDLSTHVTACPECRQLVERIQADNALLGELVQANADRLDGGPTLPQIEGYEVRREIHRGAQGVVYEAVQIATHRRVAVKTLMQGAFASERQRQRFEREVELVAALRHPNIVTLYDSGRTDDGGFYLAMELVEGVLLDEHLSGTSVAVRDRLRLFAELAGAVQAAHQRGIIHRDLKPANILVDGDGRPHVLDFGLARRERDDTSSTVAGEFLGTLAYAAPEQVSGDPADVDVRCDVYALGVILYDMLTDRHPLPLEGSMADVVETILHTLPAPMDRSIDSDLVVITRRALDKDPDRRYQSAGALRDDVELFLDGAPINARRDSQWYMLRKTAARHRVPLAIAAAFLALLIGYAITMGVSYRQSRRAAETLTSFLQLLTADPLQRRTTENTLPVLFEEADRIVDEHLADHPAVAAEVRRELGLAQLERGDFEYALDQFDQVLTLVRELRSPPHAEIAAALHNCGRASWFIGRFEEALTHYQAALTMRIGLYGREHADVARTLQHLAATERQLGRYGDAERHNREVLSIRRGLYGEEHVDVAAALNSIGVVLRDMARFDAALDRFREAYDMVSRVRGEESAGVAQALHNVVSCLVLLDRLDEAATEGTRVLAMKERLYDDTHTSLALTRALLARIALEEDRLDEADELCLQALTVQESALEPDHPALADTLLVMARIFRRRDRPEEARELASRVLEIRQERLPASHWKVTEAERFLSE